MINLFTFSAEESLRFSKKYKKSARMLATLADWLSVYRSYNWRREFYIDNMNGNCIRNNSQADLWGIYSFEQQIENKSYAKIYREVEKNAVGGESVNDIIDSCMKYCQSLVLPPEIITSANAYGYAEILENLSFNASVRHFLQVLYAYTYCGENTLSYTTIPNVFRAFDKTFEDDRVKDISHSLSVRKNVSRANSQNSNMAFAIQNQLYGQIVNQKINGTTGAKKSDNKYFKSKSIFYSKFDYFIYSAIYSSAINDNFFKKESEVYKYFWIGIEPEDLSENELCVARYMAERLCGKKLIDYVLSVDNISELKLDNIKKSEFTGAFKLCALHPLVDFRINFLKYILDHEWTGGPEINNLLSHHIFWYIPMLIELFNIMLLIRCIKGINLPVPEITDIDNFNEQIADISEDKALQSYFSRLYLKINQKVLKAIYQKNYIQSILLPNSQSIKSPLYPNFL